MSAADLIRLAWMLAAALLIFYAGAYAIRTYVREMRDCVDETPAHREPLDREPWLNAERRQWR